MSDCHMGAGEACTSRRKGTVVLLVEQLDRRSAYATSLAVIWTSRACSGRRARVGRGGWQQAGQPRIAAGTQRLTWRHGCCCSLRHGACRLATGTPLMAGGGWRSWEPDSSLRGRSPLTTMVLATRGASRLRSLL